VQALNRLHRLFLGLLPGGAPVKKSVSQYQVLLATVQPRHPAGKTRRRMAAEELEDLHRLDAKLKSMKAELKAAVLATGSHLMDIHGIGPAGAARRSGRRCSAAHAVRAAVAGSPGQPRGTRPPASARRRTASPSGPKVRCTTGSTCPRSSPNRMRPTVANVRPVISS
jgi:transposase